MLDVNQIYCGNSLELLKKLDDESVHCVVTSPAYFSLRSYLPDNDPNKYLEIGSENSLEEYVNNLVKILEEVRRVLRSDGTFWLNLGDSFFGGGYSNHRINGEQWKNEMNGDKRRSRQQDLKNANPDLKPKDLIGVPWRVAFALQDSGWYLRSEIIWAKGVSFNQKYSGSCMPESCKDRPTKSHETIFLLTKSAKYFYDNEAVKESAAQPDRKRADRMGGNKYVEGVKHSDGSIFTGGSKRNLRSVWTINPRPFKGAHFATFPKQLIEPLIKAGTSEFGCCKNCGKSYKRIIEKNAPDENHKKLCGADSNGEYLGKATKNFESGGAQNASEVKARILAGMKETVTTGFKKDCKCETDEIKPCIVLDPFAGANTTGCVAKELGRDWIGFELNPEYVKMGTERVNQILI